MKGCTSLSNLDAFISNCPSKGKRNFKNGYVYSQEFQAMLDSFDSEDCAAEANQTSEKKRRLSSEQVKALEKSFDMENKLEPERKLKLAQELGLHPRQVAIWFQNRRARCKTKHLERDYGILKASYDALKLNFDNLEQEKSGLLEELKKLKAELGGENAAGNCHVKEEECIEPVQNIFKQSTIRDNFENANQAGMNMCAQLEDRSSHGDSSGTHQDTQLMPSRIDFSPFLYTEGSSSPSSCSIMNWYDVSDSVVLPSRLYQNQNQSIKLEDQSLFLDDLCNLFSVDQAPSLQWYLPTQ